MESSAPAAAETFWLAGASPSMSAQQQQIKSVSNKSSPLQGPDENGLRPASFASCGPRGRRGGRHEWLETSAGLHEETALREDWGLQGLGAELEDEGQGNLSAHLSSLCCAVAQHRRGSFSLSSVNINLPLRVVEGINSRRVLLHFNFGISLRRPGYFL